MDTFTNIFDYMLLASLALITGVTIVHLKLTVGNRLMLKTIHNYLCDNLVPIYREQNVKRDDGNNSNSNSERMSRMSSMCSVFSRDAYRIMNPRQHSDTSDGSCSSSGGIKQEQQDRVECGSGKVYRSCVSEL